MATTDFTPPMAGDNADSRITMPLQINGDWGLMKEMLKNEFSALSDDDLRYAPGEEEALVGRLEQALGKDRDEIVAILDGVEHALNSTDAETMHSSAFDETSGVEDDETEEGDAADEMNDSTRR